MLAMAGSMSRSNKTAYQRIYQIVRQIPPGSVASYGQIADLAGLPGRARMVGYALRALSNEDDIPWERVINAKGEVSPRACGEGARVQKALLEQQGVIFNANNRIDWKRFGWRPGAIDAKEPYNRTIID